MRQLQWALVARGKAQLEEELFKFLQVLEEPCALAASYLRRVHTGRRIVEEVSQHSLLSYLGTLKWRRHLSL